MIAKQEAGVMDTKRIAFVALMGALGNILFAFSSYLGPIIPGVSTDLSHIPTFIAAIYGGPMMGFVTGLVVGILPGIQYGPLSPFGSWIAVVALPVGKSLTGLTSGLIYSVLKGNQRKRKSLFTIPVVLAAYVPECLFTVFYFVALLPYLVGSGGASILMFILPKAWAEIVFISFFMAALVGNDGFNSFVAHFFNTRSAAPQP